MKKLIGWIAMTLLVSSALLVAPAPAKAATTEIRVTMPGLVILYYKNQITFNLSQSDLSTLLAAGGDEGTATITTSLTGDAGVTGSTFTEPSSLTGTISNFWAVRSIAPSGQSTQVTVTVSDGTLSHADGDSITIANPETRVSAGTWSATPVSFAPTGLGATDVQLGDVRFDVDLSGASRSGTYDTGEITVVATNL